MTHQTTTTYNTTDQYRVTGPAKDADGENLGDYSKGDTVCLRSGYVDIEGDVLTKDGHYIRASSLTPVTETPEDDCIKIKRADLPEVVEAEPGYLGIGKKRFHASDANMQRSIARDHLALAEFLEARESEAAAAVARRDKRRSEVLEEITQAAHGAQSHGEYGLLSPALQAAIDLVIEAREQAQS